MNIQESFGENSENKEELKKKFEFPSGGFEYLGGEGKKSTKGYFKINDLTVDFIKDEQFKHINQGKIFGVNVWSKDDSLKKEHSRYITVEEIGEKVIKKLVNEASTQELKEIIKGMEGFWSNQDTIEGFPSVPIVILKEVTNEIWKRNEKYTFDEKYLASKVLINNERIKKILEKEKKIVVFKAKFFQLIGMKNVNDFLSEYRNREVK
ncbi:MAG: hypothetical protein WCX79_04075 [Candidatus Paceibacterota bacterium]|jgi:hypothetical protein